MDDQFDLAQYQLSDDERRKLLMSNALLGIGAGLLGARKGNEFGALGSGMMNGVQMGQNAVSEARKGKFDSAKMAEWAQGNRDKRSAMQAGQQLNDQLANFNPQAGMGSRSGSTADAAQIPNHWQGLMQKADIAANAGDEKRAEAFRKAAEFYRPKFSQSPQVGTDPQGAYQFVLDEQGNEKRLGAGVKPDFAEVNTGGDVRFVNRNTMPAAGQSFAKTLTPGEVQAGQNFNKTHGLAVNADRRAGAAAAQANAPAWVNDLERGIQIDPRSGQSRPITSGGAPIGAKGESKKAESAASAQSIIDLARPLIDDATGSDVGSIYDRGARVFGASTGGADAIGKLQVLQARLMMEQPRMEGPQGEKDVILYEKAAGQIGDPTVTRSQKLAALDTIEMLNKRYNKKIAPNDANDVRSKADAILRGGN